MPGNALQAGLYARKVALQTRIPGWGVHMYVQTHLESPPYGM